jgi:hypothetical protein
MAKYTTPTGRINKGFIERLKTSSYQISSNSRPLWGHKRVAAIRSIRNPMAGNGQQRSFTRVEHYINDMGIFMVGHSRSK